jgi:uncharacterized coiled-coil protein SlyX
MPISWLALLKTVPWSDVLSAAPQVAGGARSLWDAVAKKSPADISSAMEVEAGPGRLEMRIDQNDAAIAALNAQMLSASEIIAKLADQNTLLVAKIEVFRVRFLWLGCITAAALCMAVASLIIIAK